jgi:uridine phosphorylase
MVAVLRYRRAVTGPQASSQVVFVGDRVYHLGLSAAELRPCVFLVGDPARAFTVAERFDSVEHEVRHREYVTLTGSHRGLPVSVIGTGIGPDNVEIALVEAWAIAERPLTAIRIGTSGGLREDVPVGTLVVSSYAIGLDSTGLFYDSPPADDTVAALEREARRAIDAGVRPGSRFAGAFAPYASRATPAVVAALERSAASLGARAVTGATVTSPGFYAPSGRRLPGVTNTVEDVKQRLARIETAGVRVYNMEMESSLLFHLGSQLGVRTGTICPTISNPSGHGRVAPPAPFVAQAIDVALAAMHDLAASDAER